MGEVVRILKYMTTKSVIEVHDQLIEKSGGSLGLKDYDKLKNCRDKLVEEFSTVQLSYGFYLKIASFMRALVDNQPFVDGNKRTALAVALIHLEKNERGFTASSKEMIKTALKIENGQFDTHALAEWIWNHTEAGSLH